MTDHREADSIDSPIAGVILAGGGARRFGGAPKGLATIGGIRTLDRVAAALRPLVGRLVIMSGNADAGGWLPDAEAIADDSPGLGPLGGIATALRVCGCDVLVVGWDMPLVTAAVLRPLLSAPPEKDSAFWATARGVQPLGALYRRSSRPAIVQALELGTRRATEVVALLRTHVLDWTGDEEAFMNVNTPADLTRAEWLVEHAPVLAAAGRSSPRTR